MKSPTPECNISIVRWRGCQRLHFLPMYVDFISHLYQLFLVSCLFVNSASCKQCELFPLHVNQNSRSYFCVLREGYYVIIWLIVRICVFIKYWKLIYSELFILKVDINCTACICRGNAQKSRAFYRKVRAAQFMSTAPDSFMLFLFKIHCI